MIDVLFLIGPPSAWQTGRRPSPRPLPAETAQTGAQTSARTPTDD